MRRASREAQVPAIEPRPVTHDWPDSSPHCRHVRFDDFAGARAYAGVGATAETVLDVHGNGANIGAIALGSARPRAPMGRDVKRVGIRR
jgi:hypothetical protein